MRRTHLRGHENILKRQLIHVGAFNLSLIFLVLALAQALPGNCKIDSQYSFLCWSGSLTVSGMPIPDSKALSIPYVAQSRPITSCIRLLPSLKKTGFSHGLLVTHQARPHTATKPFRER